MAADCDLSNFWMTDGCYITASIRSERAEPATHSGADAGVMRSATVRLHRPVNQMFTVAISRPRPGRASANVFPAQGDRSCLASASLVRGADTLAPCVLPVDPAGSVEA
jgi:hypothetical protein